MEAIAPSKSLVEKAYDSLVDAICTGIFKPGERLTQDEIADRLDVSRQPVNSAIAMLKLQRIVQDSGRRGVVVAPVDRRLFEAIYQVRSVIEPLAVELATSRLDAPTIRRGRSLVSKGLELIQSNNPLGVLQADMSFHTLIYELSGNPIIIDTMRLNWLHIRRSMGEVLRFPGMNVQVWKEHKQILEAMIAGDAEAASSNMRSHIVEAPKRILEIVKAP